MKVYINARFLTQPITGVQRFGIEISKELKNILGDRVMFLTPSNVLHKDLFDLLDAKIVGAKKGHLWEQIDLPNYLRKIDNPLLINLANTAPLRYKNKVSTIHDVAFEVYPKTYNKSFLYFYKFLIPRIIHTSKHIITVSKFSREEISKLYNVEIRNISIIYNAVGHTFKCSSKTNRDVKYFLAVSSLNYRKNLLAALRAFETLSSENPDVQMYIVGDVKGDSFSRLDLEKKISNKQIIFLGRISDEELVYYYSNATAFIYPSLYEGFGIPPLEAQTCGCPILLSNTSCLPEIFGDSALYCNPFNDNTIVDGMSKLLNDESVNRMFREKGLVNSQRFSWKKSASDLIEVISSL